KIEVLKPIKWVSVRRNEVGTTASERSSGIFIEDNRQQRAGLFLKDVAYRLHAELEFIPPPGRPKVLQPVSELLYDKEEQGLWQKDENPGKYNAMFERRASKGQCFNQPYLGCREFSCDFRLIDDLRNEPDPVDETRDLGFMLYDLDFAKEPENPAPAFFRPQLKNGAIEIPDWESEEVKR
ncbi:MAG: type I-C CRISPR-associated protein Cas5, partial [Desulfobulbaceae bacterium]|nr:type I-C CRISPR-associated protein Cas5 [Desulfobulbaceae bacterium]